MNANDFFSPKSVAIVGASREEGKVGHAVVAALKNGGFKGRILPVNPKASEVLGLPCAPSLKALKEAPDLVVIVVPAKAVPAVMRECADLKVRSAIVLSAGFKEVGKEGRDLEESVLQIARAAGIRFLGPNCLGAISPGDRLNASFGGDLPSPGGLAYISQSGALLTAILDLAKTREIGFSRLVSIGNKADLNEVDFLRTLGDDPATTVIAGYLESISDGAAFMREAERISDEKPILLMKSGGTASGSKAASSHTGSLAGDEVAYDCVFERAGVVRCQSIEHQFELAQVFLHQPLPGTGPDGKVRTVVITNAGGPGIMATDAVERQGLAFAELAEGTVRALEKALPPASNVHNPIDVLGDALVDRYETALEAALADPGVDAIVVLLTPQAMTDAKGTAEAVVRISKKTRKKPIVASFLGGRRVADGLSVLRQGGIPTYDSPESAVGALHALGDYARWRARPQRVVRLFPVNRRKVETILERHARAGLTQVGEADAKEILEAYGFRTPKDALATTADQAAEVASQLGFPVVLKIASPDIVHKSDAGGVKVGLASPEAVRDAFDLMMVRIPKKVAGARLQGVLVQEMCQGGLEVILGMNRDPQFGPLMMFGMGGILVEVLKDVAFHLAPLTAAEAREMLEATKTYRLLTGVRGREGVDLDAVAEGLQRLSQLVTEFPSIQELDINPYVVGPPGTRSMALDARIRIAARTP